MYRVYRAFDKKGRSYIGCTTKALRRRISGHLCEAKHHKTQMPFHAALRQGRTFQWEVLFETESKEEAFEKEKLYIEKFSSREKGYNVFRGGVGLDPGHKATRRKISATLKTKYHGDPGTRLKHSRERNGKEVWVFLPDGALVGSYPTQVDACETLGLPKSKVCVALQGKRKTVNGYIIKTENVPPDPNSYLSDRNHPIRGYKDGALVGQWPSIRSAAEELRRSPATLRAILDGRREDELFLERI